VTRNPSCRRHACGCAAREHFKRWNRYEDVNEYGILQEEFERS